MEYMYGIIFDFVSGLTLGIEHIDMRDTVDDDEDEMEWAIVFHLLILRFSIIKYLPEEENQM